MELMRQMFCLPGVYHIHYKYMYSYVIPHYVTSYVDGDYLPLL